MDGAPLAVSYAGPPGRALPSHLRPRVVRALRVGSAAARRHGQPMPNVAKNPIRKHLVKYILLTLYPLKGSRDISDILTLTFYQNDFGMRNTSDVTGGKPIAV
jgi:hypothetical protein